MIHVPHWIDGSLRIHPWIDVRSRNPIEVVAKIARARLVITSSLHARIVADALGIPNEARISDSFATTGGEFKWHDYAASIGVEHRWGEARLVPGRRLVEPTRRIEAALAAWGDEWRSLSS